MTSALDRQRRWRRVAAFTSAAGLALSTFSCSSSSRPVAVVQPGIEILASDSAAILAGLRVGLVTNHTGLSREGVPAAQLLLAAGIDVVALFAPEHGLAGTAEPGEAVADHRDEATGLPVYSLYGSRRAPDPATLAGMDALVFDIQDIGARYYTYVSSMAEAMRAAAAAGLLFVVADRPNPIGGDLVQGNVLHPDFASFVGPFPVAMRHGMTVGELARMFNEEFAIGASLRVIRASGWNRSAWADDTGIPWIPTSPNMPDLESASHYPGTCLFEGTGLSVGRGTDRPFQQIGAPWLESEEVIAALAPEDLAGVRVTPVSFTPLSAADAKFESLPVRGIRLEVTDRSLYDPTRTAVALLTAIRRSAGAEWEWRPEAFDRLAGTDRLRLDVESEASVREITAAWAESRTRFLRVRAKYLIYPAEGPIPRP